MLEAAILHRDDQVIVLDKPPGLAVQGGTRSERHLDGLLDALRFGYAERPRLVHRLDKDTSGVLVIARTAAAAAFLTRAFRDKTTRKIYWALAVGRPKPAQGRISLALAKQGGPGGERVRADPDEGKNAVTYYRVIDSVGEHASWLALLPITGRTHSCVHIAPQSARRSSETRNMAALPRNSPASRMHGSCTCMHASWRSRTRRAVSCASWHRYRRICVKAGNSLAFPVMQKSRLRCWI